MTRNMRGRGIPRLNVPHHAAEFAELKPSPPTSRTATPLFVHAPAADPGLGNVNPKQRTGLESGAWLHSSGTAGEIDSPCGKGSLRFGCGRARIPEGRARGGRWWQCQSQVGGEVWQSGPEELASCRETPWIVVAGSDPGSSEAAGKKGQETLRGREPCHGTLDYLAAHKASAQAGGHSGHPPSRSTARSRNSRRWRSIFTDLNELSSNITSRPCLRAPRGKAHLQSAGRFP